MIRKIIKINEEKCNGCGLCAEACHEGAIGMVDGKAKLLRDDYCDGLGDCLPACPTDAITFEEREAAAYDEAAVEAHKARRAAAKTVKADREDVPAESALVNWPVQIKLAPVSAPYFDGADLLIAADCTAYAYSSFHRDFISKKITLIGCPKLDDVDYSQKLEQMISANHIRSITLVRMEVPCCGGIEAAVKRAVQRSGKSLPVQVVIISTDGRILK
mgnify:CR=1 FL=1